MGIPKGLVSLAGINSSYPEETGLICAIGLGSLGNMPSNGKLADAAQATFVGVGEPVSPTIPGGKSGTEGEKHLGSSGLAPGLPQSGDHRICTHGGCRESR